MMFILGGLLAGAIYGTFKGVRWVFRRIPLFLKMWGLMYIVYIPFMDQLVEHEQLIRIASIGWLISGACFWVGLKILDMVTWLTEKQADKKKETGFYERP